MLARIFLMVAGLLAISSAHAETTILGRLLTATCNTRYGISMIEVAVYDESRKQIQRMLLNLVNDQWCSTEDGAMGSKIVDLSAYSIFGTDSKGKANPTLIQLTLNRAQVVVDLRTVPAKNKLAEIYQKFNLLDYENYPVNMSLLRVSLFYPVEEQSAKKLLNLAQADN